METDFVNVQAATPAEKVKAATDMMDTLAAMLEELARADCRRNPGRTLNEIAAVAGVALVDLIRKKAAQAATASRSEEENLDDD